MMRILVSTVVFALGVVASSAQLETPNSSAVVAWEMDCSSLSGWHDATETPGMNAKVDQFEPSVIRVTQEGNDTWGKVAYVVENVDLSATPILEIKVNKVDQNSAFTVSVAPSDWSEMIDVIKRSSADGIHKGDIRKAVRASKEPGKWKGPISFNVVIVIEGKGKASYFDWLKIRADD